ncbi:MAG: PH domain-containing protein [Candidatus Latescibacterota bacterium]|nr:MAG: PH domain-containing protein [Candidatus Latescibacterota bacterium]
METRIFRPSGQYLGKLALNVTLLATAIGVAALLMGWLISLEEGGREGGIVATVLVIVNTAWWLVAILLVGPYYRSLSYEIQNDEVIVRVGIFVKSVKHVPYRTVTNIAVKRDIFDRWFFGIGTLNIQTAGMSGAKGAEESLVGLPNHQEVYEIVADELRRFRSGMAPTAAETDDEPAGRSAAVLGEILSEIKAIRRAKEA